MFGNNDAARVYGYLCGGTFATISDYCDRRRLILDREFFDSPVVAVDSPSERPEFARMLAEIVAERPAGVVVPSLWVLSRNASEARAALFAIADAGAVPHVVGFGPLDHRDTAFTVDAVAALVDRYQRPAQGRRSVVYTTTGHARHDLLIRYAQDHGVYLDHVSDDAEPGDMPTRRPALSALLARVRRCEVHTVILADDTPLINEVAAAIEGAGGAVDVVELADVGTVGHL